MNIGSFNVLMDTTRIDRHVLESARYSLVVDITKLYNLKQESKLDAYFSALTLSKQINADYKFLSEYSSISLEALYEMSKHSKEYYMLDSNSYRLVLNNMDFCHRLHLGAIYNGSSLLSEDMSIFDYGNVAIPDNKSCLLIALDGVRKSKRGVLPLSEHVVFFRYITPFSRYIDISPQNTYADSLKWYAVSARYALEDMGVVSKASFMDAKRPEYYHPATESSVGDLLRSYISCKHYFKEVYDDNKYVLAVTPSKVACYPYGDVVIDIGKNKAIMCKSDDAVALELSLSKCHHSHPILLVLDKKSDKIRILY